MLTVCARQPWMHSNSSAADVLFRRALRQSQYVDPLPRLRRHPDGRLLIKLRHQHGAGNIRSAALVFLYLLFLLTFFVSYSVSTWSTVDTGAGKATATFFITFSASSTRLFDFSLRNRPCTNSRPSPDKNQLRL